MPPEVLLVNMPTAEDNASATIITTSTLQTLPDELLVLILQYVSFRGLRDLLHCPSERLASLVHQRLVDWQTCLRARPGAAEECLFVPHAWDERPWPDIDQVGKRLLGKEFVLMNTTKDDFVRSVDDE